MVQQLRQRVYVLDFGTLIASGPTDRRCWPTTPCARPTSETWSDGDGRPTPAAADAAARARDVDAGYGPFRALFGVSFTVAPGAVLALLGSNGAGKTTIARVCSGLDRADARAACCFDGDDITGQQAVRSSPGSASSHAPEGRSVFASLTVEENLELDVPAQPRASRGARPRSTRPTSCSRASASGASRSRARSRAASSACSRWRGCWSTRPELLIADELSLGLAPIIVDEVYRDARRRSATRARRCSSSSSTCSHALGDRRRRRSCSPRARSSYSGPRPKSTSSWQYLAAHARRAAVAERADRPS